MVSNEAGVLRTRVTIRDVAGAAGVSIATVSLALSGHPSVADATKERVRQEAVRLGYSPSAVGRALQAKRTNAVGLVVPHSSEHVFSHLYFMGIMSGVSAVLNEAGMTLMLSTSPTENSDDAAYIKIVRSQQVDGVILASAPLHDKNIARLQRSSHPLVLIGRYPLDPSMPAVGIDDFGGAREATRHLLSHGHTRIAHISGPLAHLSAIDRYEAYKQALQEAGIEPRPDYCYEGDYSEAAGWEGTMALMSLDQPPTAIFAGNDEAALGVISALKELGIAPGADFPVVGFDDLIIARVVTPALTTVRQPMRELGAEAARHLMTLMRGGTPEQLQVQLPVELVVRRSCGCG